jgi:hypothetical protein
MVTGVAPDFHVFCLDIWIGAPNDGIEIVCEKLISLTHRWNPEKISFESIGFQYWFKSFVEQRERERMNAILRLVAEGRMDRDRAESLGRGVASRMVEADKTSQSKEWVYRESLSPWINHGIFHIHATQHHAFIRQLLSLTNEREPIDLVDCASQGPDVWQPPIDSFIESRFRRQRQYVEKFIHHPHTKIGQPWQRPSRIRGMLSK